MNPVSSDPDTRPSKEETYRALLRSLKRRKRFGIVFVQCSPAEAERLKKRMNEELPEKAIASLKLSEPVGRLIDMIQARPDKDELDILVIEGLEKSLEPYIKPGYGGEGDYYNLDTVPTILNHLNQQRENFRDRFHNLCFVFILPAFAVRYIIQRAPDFFDWSTGVFNLSTSDATLAFSQTNQQAIQINEQSLENRGEKSDRSQKAEILGNLGTAYYLSGQFEKAIEFLKEAAKIAQEIGDRTKELSSLDNLGNAYQSLGQYERAIHFHQQSLEVARLIGDRGGEANSLGNLGNAYQSLGQYHEAIEFYQQSLKMTQEIGDRRGETIAWFNLGIALSNVERNLDAIGAYRNARELFQAMELDDYVQRCDEAIDILSATPEPVPVSSNWLSRIRQWIGKLWRWLRSRFRPPRRSNSS